MEKLDSLIRRVPHFPKKGILFYDVTTLIKEATGFQLAIDTLTQKFEKESIDLVAGMESRGFIIGAGLALKLGKGFVPIRKPGKLPAKTIKENYTLEYGEGTLELHEDAISPGQRVLLVDDLIATGGTLKASIRLIERLGGIVVGCGVIVELTFLPGRALLNGYPLVSLIRYDSEEIHEKH
jgi:adenine phosphoribosyltransferase